MNKNSPTLFSKIKLNTRHSSSGIFFSYRAHCMNERTSPRCKLREPCKQMEGHDTAINGCAVDQVAAASLCGSSHGRASLQRRPAFLWWKQSQSSEWRKLKGVKHNRVKRANPAFCSRCLYCEVCAKHGVIFLTLPMKRGFDFHRPVDLLRAGVSQIQFHLLLFFFAPLPFLYTSQLTILLPGPSAYEDLNIEKKLYLFQKISKSLIFFEYCDCDSCENITRKWISITQVGQLCCYRSHLTVSVECVTIYDRAIRKKLSHISILSPEREIPDLFL